MRKLAPARVSHRGEGTPHIEKIRALVQIANMSSIRKSTHVLSVPAHREADFTPEQVVVPRLHDTIARFRAGTKFSLRCRNRGEFDPV